MEKTIGVAVLALALVALLQISFSYGQTPVEVGQVKWKRDIEQAKTISAKTGKPLFVQFQEVPG